MQLVMTHVERNHVTRAMLQEHIGETASGRADVESEASVYVDVKDLEGMGELDPATADPRVLGRGDADIGVGRNQRARFECGLTRHDDLASENQRARLLARFDEAAMDQQCVKAHAARVGRHLRILTASRNDALRDACEVRLSEADGRQCGFGTVQAFDRKLA
jgi:hypothetical protein